MPIHEHQSGQARMTVITRAFVSEAPMAGNTARPRVQTVIRISEHGATKPQQAAVHVGSLGKGFAWTLIIEFAAALGIYAIWHFWNILRLHF